jgi:hypothetical protein
MFTPEEIEEIHGRLGSAETLSEYVRSLAALGVERHDSFVCDGHSDYAGCGDRRVTSGALHLVLSVARRRRSERPSSAGATSWLPRATTAVRTIAHHLRLELGDSPSVATIWRILQRQVLTTPQPHKRPRSSFIRFAADLPNELWQADTTHWQLADGSDVEILDCLDDHSRLLVVCDAFATVKGRRRGPQLRHRLAG